MDDLVRSNSSSGSKAQQPHCRWWAGPAGPQPCPLKVPPPRGLMTTAGPGAASPSMQVSGRISAQRGMHASLSLRPHTHTHTLLKQQPQLTWRITERLAGHGSQSFGTTMNSWRSGSKRKRSPADRNTAGVRSVPADAGFSGLHPCVCVPVPAPRAGLPAPTLPLQVQKAMHAMDKFAMRTLPGSCTATSACARLTCTSGMSFTIRPICTGPTPSSMLQPLVLLSATASVSPLATGRMTNERGHGAEGVT